MHASRHYCAIRMVLTTVGLVDWLAIGLSNYDCLDYLH